PVAVEGRALDDPTPHLVHEAEHLLVVRVGVLVDAVLLQGVGRAPAALVERGDEPPPVPHLFELLLVHVPLQSTDAFQRRRARNALPPTRPRPPPPTDAAPHPAPSTLAWPGGPAPPRRQPPRCGSGCPRRPGRSAA